MSDPQVQLYAMSGLPQLDARRGLIRISPQVMAAIGVAPWDVVTIAAGRTTAALVAKSGLGADPRVAWCDDLTMRNGQIRDVIAVARAPLAICRSLVLHGPAFVMEAVDPLLLRSALLGKAVTAGDQVSILPQDYRILGVDPSRRDAERTALVRQIGQGWQQMVLEVRQADPGLAGMVAASTEIRWDTSFTLAVQQPGSASNRMAAGLEPVTIAAQDADNQAAAASAPSFPVPFARSFPPATNTRSGTPRPVALAGLPPDPGTRPTAPAQVSVPPGLAEPTRQLVEWLELDFHQQELLRRLGSDNQLGALITAPPGAGCSEVIAAACAAVGARLVRVWAPEAAAQSDPNAFLRNAFALARSAPPAVLLIDDVDALVPAEVPHEPDVAHVATMLLIEEAVRDPQVAVLCTSRQPGRVHPDVRHPGRLDRELVIAPPDQTAREQMLAALTAAMPLSGVDLADIASRTTGFVLADLRNLIREAATRAAFRMRNNTGVQDAPAAVVTAADFAAALDTVPPSTAEGRALPLPDVRLDDVGDLVEVKRVLTEVVLWPLRHPETFARLGVQAPAGVLLYGPPGCGKTHIVRALAGSGQLTVFSVKGAELLSKWVGESERGVREVFRTARAAAPSLIFLDEVDALAPVRGEGTDSGTTDRVVAALLTELDGIDGRAGVVVVAATNRMDRVDPAVLRPGRLERHVQVPPPDAAARVEILRVAARRSPLEPDVDLAAIAIAAEGFSAADCAALVREAALSAMRESMDLAGVSARHFQSALATITPSLR